MSTLGYLEISELGKKYVNEALNNNRLSRGIYTGQLEREFAALHDSTFGVFCNSGTSALQIALAALKERNGWRDGDEVLVPAITFIATSNVVIQNNLKPVFVDVDAETYNMDVRDLYRRITPRSRCIIPVHLFGLPADMMGIMAVAKLANLSVIEDSCETMFAKCRGKSVGSFGEFGCFSTYVAHILVGGVGGLVTTNDPELAEICRSLLSHGRDKIYLSIDDDNDVDDAKLKMLIQRRYSFDRVGYSYRATELEAAIALSELANYKYIVDTRRFNAGFLTEALRDLQGFLQLPRIPEGYDHSFMMYPLVDLCRGREDLLLHLEQNDIETRYMFPLLSQPIYRKLFPGLEDNYPVARLLEKQGFFIGIHQGTIPEELLRVSKVFHDFFKARK